MGTFLRNIVLGISLAAPIGPSGVAVIQNGLRQGFLRAFLTGLGVTLADTSYLLLVFFGLSGFMQVRLVQILVWILGAVVLFYFGYRSLRGASTAIDLEREVVVTARSPLLVGYMVNISNPIAVVWWLGVFGSLLSETDAGLTRLSALASSATILIGILAWHSTVSLLSHWGKRFLNQRWAKYVSIIAGIALLFFGLRFGYLGLSAALSR
jgi:threonine/homoserine/homoserine lactone efflux protein